MAIKEYRDWVRQFFLQLAADTGVADPEALADALIVLYDGALATAAAPARTAAMTAKRIALLTFAAAKARPARPDSPVAVERDRNDHRLCLEQPDLDVQRVPPWAANPIRDRC